jgi:zinc transporter ZupT
MEVEAPPGRPPNAGPEPPPPPGAPERGGAPAWLLAAVPLALIAVAVLAFAALGGPGLGERPGPPAEELAVERSVLRPGSIELVVRNAGPDPVEVAQVFVNDAYVDYRASEPGPIDPLESRRLWLDYPWQEGSPYLVTMLTSAGGTIEHEIELAVETPPADLGFYALMALLGVYVGIVPVALGMLFLPFLGRVPESWIRVFMAVTVGLLGFLVVDGALEGIEIAAEGSGAFGGPELVVLGAVVFYLAVVVVDRYMAARQRAAEARAGGTARVALLVAVGIGLHNLGEGLAIGSAYAVGALALGAFLVIGFALHNTTEGLAIVTPLAGGRRPSLLRLAALGLIAGAPAIVGAWIGAAAFDPSLAAFLLGGAVGAIVKVIQQVVPFVRDRAGRVLYPASIGGILAGMAALYLTGLLVNV